MLTRVVAVIVALLLAACNQGDAADDALDLPDPSGLRARRVPPGAEEVNMAVTFSNRSDQPVTLKSIEPVAGKGLGEFGEVVRVEIARRDPPFVVLSTYGTYPPVQQTRRGCIVQKIYSVEDYILRPGEEVALVVWWHALKAGRFRIDGERITYERDGETYERVVPFEIVVWVNGERPQTLDHSAARCADQVRVLPGWRLPKRLS